MREAVADVARYDTYVAAEALVCGDTALPSGARRLTRRAGRQPIFSPALSSALFALARAALNKAMQAVLDKARRYHLLRSSGRSAPRPQSVRAIRGVTDAVEPWEEFAKLGLETRVLSFISQPEYRACT